MSASGLGRCGKASASLTRVAAGLAWVDGNVVVLTYISVVRCLGSGILFLHGCILRYYAGFSIMDHGVKSSPGTWILYSTAMLLVPEEA